MNTFVYLQLPRHTLKAAAETEMSLEFQRVAALSDFPHLIALLIKNPLRHILTSLKFERSEDDEQSLNMIETALGSSEMNGIEFSCNDFSYIFILIHPATAKLLLGLEIQADALILKFETAELFHGFPDALLAYVQVNRSSKCYLQVQYYESKNLLTQRIAEYSKVMDMYGQAQIQLENVSGQVQKLKDSLNKLEIERNENQIVLKTTMQRDLECVICNKAFKKIMMLPCCHLVSCKHCAMGLENCPACSIEISHMQEVFY